MMEFIKTKKVYIALLAVLFVFVSLSEATYSLFLKSDDGGEVNYNTGLLDLKFLSDEQITLENVFPLNDSDGVKAKPYILTIKNTGTIPYLFDLKMIRSNDDGIDYKYVKVKVNGNLPHSLADNNNLLDSNLILYPDDEMTFNINIWLDINTPNSELGKSFISKVITSGSSIYKTIDKSGANHPILSNNMIPVYYDSVNKVWKKSDKSNLVNDYKWYDYDNKEWANSVTIKDSEKYIYDLTGKNNIKISDLTINNGNVVIKDNYLDLNVNYDSNVISNIFRIKFDEESDNVYIISNGNISFYYNFKNKVFTFKNGNNTVTSDVYDIELNNWYIVGYTYDGNKVSFYANGDKISSNNISGNIGNDSFKLGTDDSFNQVSKITVGDVLFYNRILSDNEISNNYKMSLKVIRDGLVSGYNEFTPMTLYEYYLSSNNGTIVRDDDVLNYFVWIPRFRYKVWNVLGEENTDTYDAKNKGIDIVFENNKNSSGTIYCDNKDCYSDLDKSVKVTDNDNNKYYTHPAFMNNDNELTGFWVGKYELDGNKYLSTYYEEVKSLGNDYHVIKNTEWGAVSYLAYSKYGLCNNGRCTIDKENDSTTLNKYGVFNISFGLDEYTMSNISENDNINLTNTHFSNTPIGNDDYEIYTNGSFILGDATREFNKFDTLYNFYIRRGLFEYSTSNDIEDENITTRIVLK